MSSSSTRTTVVPTAISAIPVSSFRPTIHPSGRLRRRLIQVLGRRMSVTRSLAVSTSSTVSASSFAVGSIPLCLQRIQAARSALAAFCKWLSSSVSCAFCIFDSVGQRPNNSFKPSACRGLIGVCVSGTRAGLTQVLCTFNQITEHPACREILAAIVVRQALKNNVLWENPAAKEAVIE